MDQLMDRVLANDKAPRSTYGTRAPKASIPTSAAGGFNRKPPLARSIFAATNEQTRMAP